MVDFPVELVRGADEWDQSEIVVCQAGQVGKRNQGEDFLGDRTDAITGNLIAGKRRSAASVGAPGVGIVNGRCGNAHVAGAFSPSGQRIAVGTVAVVRDAQVITEEKRAVLDDGTTDIPAEVVVNEVTASGVVEAASL